MDGRQPACVTFQPHRANWRFDRSLRHGRSLPSPLPVVPPLAQRRERKRRMKITMDIECSPEEARRLMGLPDMGPIHDIYLDKLKDTMSEGLTPETMDRMIRTWTPMGEVGMNAWRQMIEQMTGTSKN
jgi:hypothetical protein